MFNNYINRLSTFTYLVISDILDPKSPRKGYLFKIEDRTSLLSNYIESKNIVSHQPKLEQQTLVRDDRQNRYRINHLDSEAQERRNFTTSNSE